MDVPVKNLVKLAGQRENQLVGYGVVVGLPQTGDSRAILARESMATVLRNSGIQVDAEVLTGKNIAAVLVMANLPAVVKEGDRIDVWISSIGDAKSISGGYLLQTPLNGADGRTYAVAQSLVSGAAMKPGARTNPKNNTMYVSQGAVVERAPTQPWVNAATENGAPLNFRFKLIQHDLQTAGLIVESINRQYANRARLNEDSTITVEVPQGEEPYAFLNQIYSIEVDVPGKARLVIDQSTATIVMGHDVSISSVGIAKDGITVKVRGESSREEESATAKIEDSATAEELVDALNRLGLSAGEIIDIIKAIHAVGALHGELILL